MVSYPGYFCGRYMQKRQSGNETTFGEDLASYQLMTADSVNPAVCRDKIEHQPCAAWSGSPHDDESHLIFYPHVQLHHNYIIITSS